MTRVGAPSGHGVTRQLVGMAACVGIGSYFDSRCGLWLGAREVLDGHSDKALVKCLRQPADGVR
jgi:hypothetical protein